MIRPHLTAAGMEADHLPSSRGRKMPVRSTAMVSFHCASDCPPAATP